MNKTHHYFATTPFDWAAADTREGALAKVIQRTGRTAFKPMQAANGGVPATVMRVELPEAAKYSIENYQPHTILEGEHEGERVPVSEIEKVRITSMSGHTVPGHGEEQS